MLDISVRLKTIGSLITPGNILCDVGCDHGYLPIYMVQQHLVSKAIAMDVAKGPLEKAWKNIEKKGLSSKIETRLSDGLDQLDPYEADTVVIAGMGGMLMRQILEAGKEVLKTVKEMILSPQLDMEEVRIWLLYNGFTIDKEKMVLEDGKYYMIFHVIPGKEKVPYKEEEIYYGRSLLKSNDPVLHEYLLKEKKMKEEVISRLASQEDITESLKRRLEELDIENKRIEKALQYYYMNCT